METQTEKPRLPCILKSDETDKWYLEPWMKPFVRRIFAVHLFDSSAATYCCEMTASRELMFVEHQFEAGDNWDYLSDEQKEQIEDYFRDVETPLVEYMHIHHIAVLPEIKEGEFPPPESKGGVIVLEPVTESEDDVSDDDMFEGLQEWIQGNSI
jgi:hypothetical protein